MKILIAIAMVIVFISTFFILFTMSTISENYFVCENTGSVNVCTIKNSNYSIIISLLFISLFLLVDALTVYIVVKNV